MTWWWSLYGSWPSLVEGERRGGGTSLHAFSAWEVNSTTAGRKQGIMKSSFTIAAHPCVPLWSTRRPVHSKEQTVSLLQYFPSCVYMTRGSLFEALMWILFGSFIVVTFIIQSAFECVLKKASLKILLFIHRIFLFIYCWLMWQSLF